MKKIFLLLLVCIAALSLAGCSQGYNEPPSDFSVNNWSSSIGAIDERNFYSLDEQRFSYTLFLTSETGILHEVKSAEPILPENVSERVLRNEPPLLFAEYDHIRIEGYIIFDASELTKEQIMREPDPFITAVRVITEAGNEHIVDLRSGNIF